MEKILHLHPTDQPGETLPMGLICDVQEVLNFHGLGYIPAVDLMVALWKLIPAEKRPKTGA